MSVSPWCWSWIPSSRPVQRLTQIFRADPSLASSLQLGVSVCHYSTLSLCLGVTGCASLTLCRTKRIYTAINNNADEYKTLVKHSSLNLSFYMCEKLVPRKSVKFKVPYMLFIRSPICRTWTSSIWLKLSLPAQNWQTWVNRVCDNLTNMARMEWWCYPPITIHV